MKTKFYTQLLRSMSRPLEFDKELIEQETRELQLKMLRIQQGLWHKKDRAIVVLEGFDASGKGGAIRKLTETLDPRSVRVVPIGAPTSEEQGTHWLYRFWKNLPQPGYLTIFDRSWYGRVLVEKVDELTPAAKLKNAYDEINQFEAQLINDGIPVIKIFLAITRDEQLRRFHDRLNDPYKQWKLTQDDIKARSKWDEYVKAVDTLLVKTDTTQCPWHVIPADQKKWARREVLGLVTGKLSFWNEWIEDAAMHYRREKLLSQLNKIK